MKQFLARSILGIVSLMSTIGSEAVASDQRDVQIDLVKLLVDKANLKSFMEPTIEQDRRQRTAVAVPPSSFLLLLGIHVDSLHIQRLNQYSGLAQS